jgi:PAS domain S-box-containing protein
MNPGQAELSRHCDQFRLMVDAVEDYAIYLIDPDGRVVSWNSGAARIKGYDAKEIVGKHFSEFYTREDRMQGKPENALQVARTLGKYSEEGWRVRKDGSQFWANILITSIFEDGRLFGFAKVTRDLTEQKRTEKALLDAQAELEAKVIARTAALEAACDELRRNRNVTKRLSTPFLR